MRKIAVILVVILALAIPSTAYGHPRHRGPQHCPPARHHVYVPPPYPYYGWHAAYTATWIWIPGHWAGPSWDLHWRPGHWEWR